MTKLTSMTKEERNCSFNFAFLMDEMNIERTEAIDLDGCLIIRQLVHLRFMLSPTVAVLPVLRQAFDVGQWGSITPASFVKFVGKCSIGELA